MMQRPQHIRSARYSAREPEAVFEQKINPPGAGDGLRWLSRPALPAPNLEDQVLPFRPPIFASTSMARVSGSLKPTKPEEYDACES